MPDMNCREYGDSGSLRGDESLEEFNKTIPEFKKMMKKKSSKSERRAIESEWARVKK
jgi:hypothetical protein